MRHQGAPARQGLSGGEWGVIILLQLGTILAAFVIAVLFTGIGQFEFSGPFKEGDGLAFDGDKDRFERTKLVRCINDLCDVDMVSEKTEDLCLVVTWTNDGPDGFLVLPRPCSTGVEVGDLEDVDTDGAGPGQCLCTPDGDEFVPSGPFQLLSEKGQSDGYCPLNLAGIVPNIHLPPELMRMQGCWNANTNVPTLMSGGCPEGDFYVVSVAGSTMLDGTNDWNVGDAVVCSQGNFWKRIRSEMELNDLTDTDTTGQMNGDVLRRIGGTWVPDDQCCATAFGDPPGFLAFGRTNPAQDFPKNVWTKVDWLPLLMSSTFYVNGGPFFPQTGPHGFDFSTDTWTVQKRGWYQVNLELDFVPLDDLSEFVFVRINNLATTLPNNPIMMGSREHAREDVVVGPGSPVAQSFPVSIGQSMLLPFCPGDRIIIEVMSKVDPFRLQEDSEGAGRPLWSVRKVPDASMPSIQSCVTFPFVKKRIEEEKEEAADAVIDKRGNLLNQVEPLPGHNITVEQVRYIFCQGVASCHTKTK